MDDMPVIDDAHPFTLDKFDDALRKLYEWGVDDILLQDMERLAVQRKGRIVDVGTRPLELDTVQGLLNDMHRQTAAATLQEALDHNFGYYVTKGRRTKYRFRVNATATMGKHSNPLGLDITMRSISQIPPSLDELGVPKSLEEALFPLTGVVIVGGATGSGKSTLLGGIIRRHMEDPDGKRILTYESPIEFDFRAVPNRRGRIAQSEVYSHLKDYAHATSNALRRHPDVIVLGEARDAETIQGAVHNAETGHAVYSTVHVNSVSEMLGRMAGVFPANERARAISGLIGSGRVFLYQTLLKTVDGGRCAAREWLVMTDEIRRHLYSTDDDHITREMKHLVETHGRPLMRDIEEHYEAGRIDDRTYDRFKAEAA